MVPVLGHTWCRTHPSRRCGSTAAISRALLCRRAHALPRRQRSRTRRSRERAAPPIPPLTPTCDAAVVPHSCRCCLSGTTCPLRCWPCSIGASLLLPRLYAWGVRVARLSCHCSVSGAVRPLRRRLRRVGQSLPFLILYRFVTGETLSCHCSVSGTVRPLRRRLRRVGPSLPFLSLYR